MFCRTVYGVVTRQRNLVARSYLTPTVTSPSLLNTTYHSLLRDQVQKYPHKDCVRGVSEDDRFNYAEVLKNQNAFASGIVESGGKGSFTTSLGLRTELFMAQLGTARADFDWASLPPLSPIETLERDLKLVNSSILVWPPKVHKTVQLEEIYKLLPRLERMPRDLRISDPRFPSLRTILHTAKKALPGMTSLADFFVYDAPHTLNRIAKAVDSKKENTLIVDNGELVRLSQHNIINCGYLVGQRINLNEEDIVCTTLHPSRSDGLALGLGMVLSHKTKLVWASEIFDAPLLASALGGEFCTTLVISPSDLTSLLGEVKAPIATLTKLIVAATPEDLPSVSLLESAKTALGVTSVIVSFSTNNSAGAISTTPINQFKAKNMGTPLPHTQVGIVNEKGVLVSQGAEGCLQVKGFNVPNGSWTGTLNAKLDAQNNIILA